LGSKIPFLALITLLRPSRTLIGKKKLIMAKHFFRHKKLFRKAGSGKIRPFLAQNRAF
jgi:hypothetical protein